MNKPEKMPERPNRDEYEKNQHGFHLYVSSLDYYADLLESFYTQQAERIKKQDRLIENVYSMLEMYGVSRERAKRPDNGIMVLMSRMQKEINGYQYNIQKLEEERRQAIEILQSWEDGEEPYKETHSFLSSQGEKE